MRENATGKGAAGFRGRSPAAGKVSCIMMLMKKDAQLGRMLEKLRAAKPSLESRYQVAALAVFGSFTKGESRARSDLDILVSFREPPSLLRFVALENELSDELGVKVDLVMREALKPRIGERILKEIVPV